MVRGAATILDDITVSIPDGAVTAVVGPSGAGKSSLLRLLNRLERPARGTIRFRGEDLDEIDPLALRQRVGMVFQRPPLFGGMVRDNLAVAAPDATDDALIDALGRAGLGAPLLERQGDDLSGGEAQRMVLARALLVGPEVLLLDEPTAALDRASAAELERLAIGLAKSGMPMVWVSHNLDQVGRIADHIVAMVDGRVVRCGPPDDVPLADLARLVPAEKDQDTSGEGE